MEEKKERQKFLKGALCGALVMLLVLGIAWAGYHFLYQGKAANTGNEADGTVVESGTETKLELLQALIKTNFLYQDKVDKDKLVDGIYQGYINGLDDPYSVYYNAEETKALQESTAGEFGGVGATLSQDKKTGVITLLNISKDSPSGQAGLKEGDILYKVEEKEVTGLDLDKVVTQVKGDIGTQVKLTVVRKATGNKEEVTVTRGKIQDDTVNYEMKDNNIGYIHVREFDTITLEQFQAAMDDLEKQGMEGMIVDLRNNGGGNLTTVCEMLDLLLPKGLMVYTEDKNGKKTTYTSDEEHQFNKPIEVLTNGYSASASEIFAGAIQDYGMGEIIGENTYGKGVVQNIYDLRDNTCVKLTMAEYFTPKGRSIQGKGIKPDIEVIYEYDAENPDADNQLDKAISNMQEKIK